MSDLLDIAAAHFDDQGWQHLRLDGQNTLRLEITGEHGAWICYVRARDAERQLILYSTYPENVPPERRRAMAEFLTRANHGMVIGNFEMDFADGEIHYKTSIDVTGDRLTPALVDQLFRANVLTMDDYFPGIAAVMAGASPEAAITQVEG
jgi:hypothetical protein